MKKTAPPSPPAGDSVRHLVRLFADGDRLVNSYGERATVLEMLPDDPDYFARLEDDSGETFAALAENLSGWHREPNSHVHPPQVGCD